MGIKLTFEKRFDCHGVAGENQATLQPFTIDGEPIMDVVSCSVQNSANGGFPRMTLVVYVTEHIKDHAAKRLRGEK